MSFSKPNFIFVTAEKSKASLKLFSDITKLPGVVEAKLPLPPTYDVVKDFFKNEKEYYKDIFNEELAKHSNTTEYVVYFTTSKPDKILEYFPHSIVINFTQDVSQVVNDIVEDNVENTFNIYFDYLVPADNEYYKFINILKSKKDNLTKADIWAYENKKKFWQEKYYDQYTKNISNKVKSNMLYRSIVEDDKIINVNSKNKNKIKKKLQEIIK